MQTRSSRQHRSPKPSDRLVAHIQPRSWGDLPPHEAQATQPQLPFHSFSHVDLFAHDPGPRANPRLAIQPKLTVGRPNDQYEQEADRVAEQIVNTPDSALQSSVQRQTESDDKELQAKPLAAAITPLVQREAMPGEEELQTKLIQRESMPEEEELQAQSIQHEAMPEEEELVQAKQFSLLPASTLETQLNSSKSSGSPLPTEVRSFMEPRFGTDFSQVRVHTGSESVQMNRDLNAQAFTHGQDVFFGAGKAPAKDALTAHELTHVVQQSGAAVQRSLRPQKSLEVSTGQQPKIQRFYAVRDKQNAAENAGQETGVIENLRRENLRPLRYIWIPGDRTKDYKYEVLGTGWAMYSLFARKRINGVETQEIIDEVPLHKPPRGDKPFLPPLANQKSSTRYEQYKQLGIMMPIPESLADKGGEKVRQNMKKRKEELQQQNPVKEVFKDRAEVFTKLPENPMDSGEALKWGDYVVFGDGQKEFKEVLEIATQKMSPEEGARVKKEFEELKIEETGSLAKKAVVSTVVGQGIKAIPHPAAKGIGWFWSATGAVSINNKLAEKSREIEEFGKKHPQVMQVATEHRDQKMEKVNQERQAFCERVAPHILGEGGTLFG